MAHVNPEKVLANVEQAVGRMKNADAMRNSMMRPIKGNMMGGMMGDGMMGPMMGNMMGEGMMSPMMGGMNIASTAPKARMLVSGMGAGAAVSVGSSSAQMSLLVRTLRNPYLVIGLGIVAGYLIHKYRYEIIRTALGQENQEPVVPGEPEAT